MLNVISLDKALELSKTRMCQKHIAEESVLLDDACGRVLSRDIISDQNVPDFDRSTMDGFAVRAADTFGASATLPAFLKISGEIRMGEATDLSINPGQCAAIATGGMLPEHADAVIPVEYTELEHDLCLCYTSVSPLQNVTCAGDDVSTGQTVLKKGSLLSPASIGILASMGYSNVPVFARPRVGILSTGNEIVPVDVIPRKGKVRDINSHLLNALVSSFGCTATIYGIIQDDEDFLTNALTKAADENEIVLLSGGSSAGQADKTAAIIKKLGMLFCHGIAVKPGKPTVLGMIKNTPVFGLPGHPAACYFMAEMLVKTHISALFGTDHQTRTTSAILSEHISSNHGREEIVCVRLADRSAIPLYAKSGVISLLTSAHGYILIPRESEGLKKGTEVPICLF